MDWIWFLFGFDGRINRARLWLAMLVIVCWMILIGTLILSIDKLFGSPVESIHFSINGIFGFVDPTVLRAALTRLRDGRETSPAHLLLMFFEGVGTLVFVWIYLATSIKRLHDRDKGGWWTIAYFVIPGLYSQFQDRLPNSYLVLPFAIGVFALMIAGFVDLYCLRGTRWTNRFGPNPLPKVQTRPRSSHGSSTSNSAWKHTGAMEFVPHSTGSLTGAHVKRGHD
jgi:uncharacterized membrane protein YhaH (DUF805 family)